MEVDDMFDFLEEENQQENDDITKEFDEYLAKRRKEIEEKYKDLLPTTDTAPVLEAQYKGCTHEVAIPEDFEVKETTYNP